MALVTCKECKAQISDTATSCPQCGAKRKKPTSRFTILVGGLFAIGVAGAVFSGNDPKPQAPAKTPEQVKAAQEKEAAFQADVSKVKALKAALKNPNSFELVAAGRTDDKTLCVVYRATNSFNAVVTEQKAISPAGKVTDFNKACAGKSAEDITYIKKAL